MFKSKNKLICAFTAYYFDIEVVKWTVVVLFIFK